MGIGTCANPNIWRRGFLNNSGYAKKFLVLIALHDGRLPFAKIFTNILLLFALLHKNKALEVIGHTWVTSKN